MTPRLRCPHCNAEGDLHATNGLDQEHKAGDSDPILPEEAFQSFHSASPGKMRSFRAKPIALRSKLLLWVGLPLAIVIFFALLVNLILPGPTGEGFATGTSRQDPVQKR